MKIFGAGLSGLIAGVANPKAQIYERGKFSDKGSHQALLRFRDTSVSDITGIKFKKVKVIKSIWAEGKEQMPSPRFVAMYSFKNTGFYENRSIMDITTTERYIAPDNFFDLLKEECQDRIVYDYEITSSDYYGEKDIISTLPLSINARMLGYVFNTEKNKSRIYVTKIRIENCNMYNTVYYPELKYRFYRASITCDMLIIESKGLIDGNDIEVVMDSMGLLSTSIEVVLGNHIQPMGKLTDVNDSDRRVMIYKMSHDKGVYSLGRFALHKNILLDDVAKDIRVIKSMMKDDTYGISTRNR